MLEQNQNIIYFRADGNTKIGLGHITRSMALADMLKEEFDCIFLTQNPSEILQKQIKENFGLIILPETEDYLQEAKFIKETYLKENDIIVLDGYNFQTEYQQIIKSLNHSITQSSIKLVCIDDMQDWHFVADAVINHAGGVKAEDYSCEAYTKLYLGTEYALLRKPFLEAAKKERNIEKVEKVFICFGGSDIYNLSKKTTEACLAVNKFTEIHVVLGSAYPFFEDFTNFAQEHKKIQIHQNLDAEEMCDLMQHCELAIVPASSIAYEVCAIGMYMITGWYADNQKNIYRFLLANDLGLGTDNFQSIEKRISNFTSTFLNLSKQKLYFDGKFAKRLKSIFYDLTITLRNAQLDDLELYFDWANDKDVRQNAINTEKISWETHQKWFQKKLHDNNAFLYVFEFRQATLGQVRIDFSDNIGLIDYSISKQYRGLGLGKIVLQKAISAIKQIKKEVVLKAQVKQNNKASSKTFESLGFIFEKVEHNLLNFHKNL